MKTIWKTEISVTDTQVISVPSGSKFLAVQEQQGSPCIWYLCGLGLPYKSRTIHIYGTGHPIPDNIEQQEYIGTFQLAGGTFVGHVFVDRE